MIDDSIIGSVPTLPTGKSVLVFDPDPKMTVFYRFLLESHAMIPVCTTNLKDAMAALANEPERYVAAVVDVDDADAPGWHLIQSIRQMNCSESLPLLTIAELIGTRAIFADMRRLCDAIILKGDFEIPRFYEHLVSIIHKRNDSSEANAFFNAKTRIF